MTAGDDNLPTNAWRRMAPLALVVLALVAFFVLRLHRWLTLDQLVDSHAALRALISAHRAAAFSSFVIGYALFVAISAPGATALTVAAGALFGWAQGLIAGALGATLGACALFLAARSALGPWLVARAGPKFNRLRASFCADATGYMLFLRLSPLFPFWFVNLAAALAGVRFRTFLWTTVVGILPATAVFAVAGASLEQIAAAAEATRQACQAAGRGGCQAPPPLSAIVTPQILALLVGLSLIALAPVLAKKWRATRKGDQAR